MGWQGGGGGGGGERRRKLVDHGHRARIGSVICKNQNT